MLQNSKSSVTGVYTVSTGIFAADETAGTTAPAGSTGDPEEVVWETIGVMVDDSGNVTFNPASDKITFGGSGS